MSDSTSSSPNEGNSKRPPDPNEVNEDQEAAPKRARGPYDCLNWESESEEEFTPFTQSSSPPKKVIAKKSSGKIVGEKKKKNGAKNSSKSKSSTSSAKGKSIRKLFIVDFLVFYMNGDIGTILYFSVIKA